MSDQLPTATRVSDPGIRALYRLENRWQAWLDVEVALARAQAELGIIPARCRRGDRAARRGWSCWIARASTRALRAPATPSCRWSGSCRASSASQHGGWVHWGATTQNITQTGDLLVLRQAHRIFLRLIGEALTAMADLAERGADMPMAGRTHGQHAVPATFGYKVAVWIDELLRHVERLRQAAPRLFVAMLGGGAGTFASLGKQGPPVQAGIGRQLGFGTMTVPSRALGDHLAENICLLGMLAATCGKIGREVYTLMKTEFGEVEEPVPPGTVGSSTMPQKRNPKLCQDIIAASAEVRAMVPLGAGGDADGARGGPHHQSDYGLGGGARVHRDRRHAGAAGRGDARPAARSGAHAAQPRSGRRADHGRGGDAGARRDDRPAARA